MLACSNHPRSGFPHLDTHPKLSPSAKTSRREVPGSLSELLQLGALALFCILDSTLSVLNFGFFNSKSQIMHEDDDEGEKGKDGKKGKALDCTCECRSGWPNNCFLGPGHQWVSLQNGPLSPFVPPKRSLTRVPMGRAMQAELTETVSLPLQSWCFGWLCRHAFRMH